MSPSPTKDGFPAPPLSLLADGAIELRLLRVMGPHNASSRPAHEQYFAHVPEYRFAIHRLADGLRIGRIHLRMTNDNQIVHTIGHGGYAVDEPHRRQGFATRAVRLMVGLAKHWELLPVWILIESDNVASRRTVGRVGFELIDVVNSSEALTLSGIGSEVCRYCNAG